MAAYNVLGDFMLVINGKKVVYILTSIIISILFTVLTSNSYFLETSSTPISNHTVIIDAGHGSPDNGAVAPDGTSEAEINLAISLKLQYLLEASGCYTILTRSDENGIYDADKTTIKNKKISDLKNRVSLINSNNSDILVSIHLNKFQDSKYSGWQTFYRNNDDNSYSLANFIQQNLNLSIQKENNRNPLTISNKYIIDNTVIPAVIVECGFLSNQSETNLLKTDEYQEKLAWGIYTGIIDYMNSL